ncbi:unnamed protein product [Timema podura]|uniref:Uncharacterized protein n=1 Tax=Timema podura TaxID=61482 RepID=A0ABN7P7I9_TIMPD|nr:unnamed protein product [Timema podura]
MQPTADLCSQPLNCCIVYNFRETSRDSNGTFSSQVYQSFKYDALDQVSTGAGQSCIDQDKSFDDLVRDKWTPSVSLQETTPTFMFHYVLSDTL